MKRRTLHGLAAFSLLLCGSALRAQTLLALSSATATTGSPVRLDLVMTSHEVNKPAGLQWTFTYPADSVAGFLVTPGPALAAAAKNLNCAGSPAAYTCLASGIDTNLVPDGVVATAWVTVAAPATSAVVRLSGGLGATLDGNPIATLTAGATASVVTPSVLSGLSCLPGSLAPGAAAACTVTMSSPVAQGATVTLSSTGSVNVPATVAIAPGAATAGFLATAASFTTDQTASVTAALNGVDLTANLSLLAPIQVNSLQCSSTTLDSYGSTTCWAGISKPAPCGGVALQLSASPAGVLSVPDSILVPVGTTSASFTLTSDQISADSTGSVSVSLNGSSLLVTLSLIAKPLAPASLTCAATTLTPNAATVCTLRLNQPAPRNGVAGLISTSAPSILSLPVRVMVPTGAMSADFPVSAGAIPAGQNPTVRVEAGQSMAGRAMVVATLGTVTRAVTITVAPSEPPADASPLQVRCEQRQIVAGGTVVCEIHYGRSSAPDTIEFSVVSASERVNVPAAVRGRAGRISALFEVNADGDAPQGGVAIDVHRGTAHARTSLEVIAAGSLHLNVPQSLSATPGSPLRLLAATTDDLGLPVSVAVPAPPPGATFDSASGLFEWTPAGSDQGRKQIEFTASNSLGLIVRRTVTVDVVPSRPVLAGLRNGAGDGAVPACSPGAFATLTGTHLAVRSSGDGLRLLVNGIAVPVMRSLFDRVDFLCPALPPGTPLTIALETGGQRSNELQSVMHSTAPGLVSLDGSGSGQGVVVHAGGLAALPRFDRAGMPATAGDAITLFATGVDCGEKSGAPKVLLYFGPDYQPITLLRPSALAGLCEVHTIVPRGLSGNGVRLTLESVRDDGTPVRSNTVLIAVDE